VSKDKLDKVAKELADRFLNGDIVDVTEGLEIFQPMVAAYLAVRISRILPRCAQNSFEQTLARRMFFQFI
jgi:hypothetical protein